jgi:hypothetical protein
MAETSSNVSDALREYQGLLAREKRSGLAAEIGRRALARAVSSKQGSQGFAEELFAEAACYYASRDLPSFVGARGRVATTSGAIELKAKIKETSKRITKSVGKPATDSDGWATYVKRVLSDLGGGH